MACRAWYDVVCRRTNVLGSLVGCSHLHLIPPGMVGTQRQASLAGGSSSTHEFCRGATKLLRASCMLRVRVRLSWTVLANQQAVPQGSNLMAVREVSVDG